MSKHVTTGLALLAAIAFAVPSAAAISERFEQTYKLEPRGTVSVHNVNGEIQVRAWDRNEVRVEAVKRARSPAALERTRIEIEAESDRIEIRTRHDKASRSWLSWLLFWRSAEGRVNYVLHVPRDARLSRARSVNGRVHIEGVRGPIRASSINGGVRVRDAAGDVALETVNGEVEASFRDLEEVRSIRVETVNGRVALALPHDAGADFSVSTVNGRVRSDFFETRSRRRLPGRAVTRTIGDGTTRVRISTVNGGVQLRGRGGSARRAGAP